MWCIVQHVGAEGDSGAKKYDYRWESLKAHPVPEWLDDAKFGIFIHCGPHSVPGYRKGGREYAEHTPKEIYRDPEHYYGFLDKRFTAKGDVLYAIILE
jgi:alpha-L-fucosidase